MSASASQAIMPPAASTGAPSAAAPLPQVDIELLLEGSYPYVTGGVSSWVHRLITGLPEFTFGLTHIAAQRDGSQQLRYALPANVRYLQVIYLHDPVFLPDQAHPCPPDLQHLMNEIARLHHAGGPHTLAEFAPLLHRLRAAGTRHHLRELFASREAFTLLTELYQRRMPEASFIDSFWTWRFIHLPLMQILQARLAPARVVHAVSTGYAGLIGCMHKVLHNRPLLLTEHGIYTRERAIEITQAEWIRADPHPEHRVRRELGAFKRLWFDFFEVLGTWTYGLADRIVTLFEGNRRMQIGLGADEKKIDIVPNGIEIERFLDLRDTRPPDPQRFHVGFVGRVVPIKDVKTLIKAARIVLMKCPDVVFHLIGPLDEDPEYVAEIRALIDDLGIGAAVCMDGPADVREIYPRLDVSVLTSHSEGQPLTLLEAMAAGIPCVATDVGACKELLLGGPPEDRALGPCGIITSLRSPGQTANAILEICTDAQLHARMVRAGKARVRAFYQEKDLFARYRRLYRHLLPATPAPAQAPTGSGEAATVENPAKPTGQGGH